MFPDALSGMDDTVQSARDFLAVFPEVRQIEAERLALDLDRRPDALPVIEQQANEIQDAAQRSGAATENAVRALAQNDADIDAAANNSVLRNSFIADKLLVIGNFARAATGKVWSELSELGADSWEAVKENLPKGIGTAARVGPLMALMTLATLTAGAVAGVASAVHAWKPFSRVFKRMVGEDAKSAPTKNSAGPDGIQRTQNAAPTNRRRKAALPKAALEALFLVEAKKTPQWAHLDVLHIKPGSTSGSWEVEGWGQLASKPPRDGPTDFQNVPILEEIAKRLNDQFALRSD